MMAPMPTAQLDVVCVGEALVDFLPQTIGKKVREVETWTRCTGGSPANVAVGLARLGARSALVGVCGDDEFGYFLRDSLAAEGVDISHLRQTHEGKTGLVFISLTEAGERSFSFYRTRAAEQFLDARDVDTGFMATARAMHCGSNSLLMPDAQRAVLSMARATQAAGRILSCDPNLRLHMWPNPDELKAVLYQIVPLCSLVKVSEEEMEFVTGEREVEGALASLKRRGVALPVVTSGEKGAHFLWNGETVYVPAVKTKVVDTTGAGDGFVSGLLYGITQRYADHPALTRATVEELTGIVRFAAKVGSRACEKFGAVTGLPRISELTDAG
jgi:fructokinase